MISRSDLREIVVDCLGEGMEEVSPDRVRALLDRIQAALAVPPPGGRYSLDEPDTTYPQILRSFFWRMLHAPSEEAAALLWITAFEACFGAQSDMGGQAQGDG